MVGKSIIDHDADVLYSEFLELHPHIAPGSEYHRLFEEAYRETSQVDNRRNQSMKYLRQALLFQCLAAATRDGVPGDFAECGCFRGQSTFWMARLLESRGRKDRLHAFDSFQGLSEFMPEDTADGLDRGPEWIARVRKHFAFPEAQFREVMRRFDFVEVHPGWIPETFETVADRKFALVHVDVDLYEPTRNCLDFFYSRLSTGGFIVIDDYNARDYPGANIAVDRFVHANRPPFVLAGQAGAFVIRKK
jgi:predicted O-methyltransferase YrrM